MPSAPPASSGRTLGALLSPPVVETAGWLLLLVAIPLSVVDVIAGPWDHDGGFHLMRAAYAAEGLKAYLHFPSFYPPLMDFLMAPVVSLPVHRIALAIMIPVGWIMAIAVATALLVWRMTGERGIATVVASLYLLFAIENGGNHLTLESGVAFFGCLAFAMVFGRDTLTPWRLAAAGACASAAMLMKQPGALAFGPIAALMLLQRQQITRRGWTAFLAGALAPGLVLLIWLEGNLPAIYQNVFKRLLTYASHPESAPHPIRSDAFRSPQTVALFGIVIVLAVSHMIRVPRWRLIVATALGCAWLEYVPRFLRDYAHYNLNIWPFMVLIIAFALNEPGPERRWGPRAVLLLFAVLAYALLFIRPNPVYPLRWQMLSPLTTTFYPAAKIIEIVTPADAAVRQYGEEPILEFLAYRRQEILSKSFEQWDPSEMYSGPPDPRDTVVVVNTGQAWLAPVVAEIERRGFVVLARVGNEPVISIYRHRSRAKPRDEVPRPQRQPV